MALPGVGTTVGSHSPKRPRGHQVLRRDLCPGMLPAVSAVCRWHSGSLPEQAWSLWSLSCPGHPNPLCPLPAGPSPIPAVPRGCRRALCPEVAVPRDRMSPHLHPKARLSPRTEHPEPSTPHKPRHEETAKGSPCPSQGRNRSPGAMRPRPTAPPSLTPPGLPVPPPAHLLGGERHADAVLLDQHGATGTVPRARRGDTGTAGSTGGQAEASALAGTRLMVRGAERSGGDAALPPTLPSPHPAPAAAAPLPVTSRAVAMAVA